MIVWQFQWIWSNSVSELKSTWSFLNQVSLCDFLTISKFSSKHNSPRPWHCDTVEQRIVTQVEVDEGSFHPNLGKAEPKCYLHRPAFHEESHDITWNPSLMSCPVSHRIWQLIQLCEGPRFPSRLIDQCWFVWVQFYNLCEYGRYVTSIAHVAP